MIWKKIGKALLFPPFGLLLLLLPVATVFLVYAMVFVGEKSAAAMVSYVLAAYTLTIWCARGPAIWRWCRRFGRDNRYLKIWKNDPQLQVRVSLYLSLLVNTAYALLQLGMGFYHRSFWFHSMAIYYLCLVVMRFFLARYAREHQPGANMRAELVRYRACGWTFLLMNLALSLMVFFMVYWNRTFHHHEITTITMAAYTFYSLIMAIIHAVESRKSQSPLLGAVRTINLAAASVSMLTLESTMLTTFDDGTLSLLGRRILLGISGGVLSLFVIIMAIRMIVLGSRKLKQFSAKWEIVNGKKKPRKV